MGLWRGWDCGRDSGLSLQTDWLPSFLPSVPSFPHRVPVVGGIVMGICSPRLSLGSLLYVDENLVFALAGFYVIWNNMYLLWCDFVDCGG
ncbi:hypothetical protein P280DRAFT_21662 [Massarina eburnea CBS 473.64]|uniref:Uncharacterized protein n=1 Tax=Massarina eburnea CBS 473.64 TaxID=1395130 RepID=A0A6A6SIV1_9PLEO|nr:hypothetical protein P280DRAFT_21662 [Massarina eburnea CBS 473.64]